MTWAKDMLTLAFGTVVPLTQLQSDLYSFLMGIAGAAPVMEVRRLRRCWAVARRGCVGGFALAADAATCRDPGRAGGRQRNQGCTARGDGAIHLRRDPDRSTVIVARDGTASAQ